MVAGTDSKPAAMSDEEWNRRLDRCIELQAEQRMLEEFVQIYLDAGPFQRRFMRVTLAIGAWTDRIGAKVRSAMAKKRGRDE